MCRKNLFSENALGWFRNRLFHCRPDGQPTTLNKKLGGKPPFPLEQPALSERNRVSASDDEMIEHTHIYQSQCLLKRLCQEFVRAAGLGNSGRMVVRQDH